MQRCQKINIIFVALDYNGRYFSRRKNGRFIFVSIKKLWLFAKKTIKPRLYSKSKSIFLCSSSLADTSWHPNTYSDLQHFNIVSMLYPTTNICRIHFIYSSVPWFRYLVDKIVIFVKNRWRLSLLFIKLFKLTLFFSTKVFL